MTTGGVDQAKDSVAPTQIEIVARFLSTVVVVDDRATFEPPVTAEGQEAEAGETATGQSEHEAETPDTDPLPHGGLTEPQLIEHRRDLSAPDLGRAFGDRGMVCMVVEPRQNGDADQFSKSVVALAENSARRADVLVLDWSLSKTENVGLSAKAVLRTITHNSARPIQLVCIYTGDPTIRSIAQTIAAELGGNLLSEFEVRLGPTAVVVLGKPHNVDAPHERRVEEAELPERVLHEFARVVAGLIPGVALAALGAVRDNSGALLGRFRKSLDPGFLGHRSLLPHPEDSLDHLRDALIDELNAIVAADETVTNALGSDRCIETGRILRRPEGELAALDQKFHRVVGETDEDLSQRIESVVDQLVGSGLGLSDGAKKWTSRVFAGADEAYASDLGFGELLQFRHHYGDSPPVLSLGAVVVPVGDGADLGRAMICVQPLCDSVRVDPDGQVFPFVELHRVDKDPARFVLLDADDIIPFSSKVKLFGIKQLIFVPDAERRRVLANQKSGSWEFLDREGKRYRYLARLRMPLAQAVVHELGSEASRVGIDEPEWIRRGRAAEGTRSAP